MRSLKLVAAVAVTSVGLLVSSEAYPALAASMVALPSPETLSQRSLPNDTLIYDRTGVLLADLHPPGFQHYHQPLSSMGRLLPTATIDIEDASFWHESGVNLFSILRAAIIDLEQRRIVEGGSTITQQLVKLRVVGGSPTLVRKLREAVMAMEVSGSYTRSQVLEMYLNTIYYGNDAYGAAAAAQNYFHTGAAQLDLAQASMLAGLPDNANLYDPFSHWGAAKQRQHEVLQAMVRNHSITQRQADLAFAEDISPPNHMFRAATLNLAPAFVAWVAGELAAEYGQKDPERAGLHVTTTLDWRLEQLAQQAITQTVAANAWRSLTDGALVAVDPGTGQVLAMVGSAGSQTPGGDYNLAVWPPRNPGSSFKIFNYADAIASRRFTMVTPILDAPIQVSLPGAPPYAPVNYDRAYHGICQLQQCLGNSLNVPAVEVEMINGVASVARMATAMGAPPFLQTATQTYTNSASPDSFGPSLTLGGYGETPLQMATGASVLASGGVLHQPRGVLSVRTTSGKLLRGPEAASAQVLDPGVAYIMSQMLSNDANRAMTFGRGSELTLPGRRVASKTGTTDNFTDGWTVGYTPSLATAVWMGNADFHPMAWNSDGVYVAAPVWHAFMQAALDTLRKGDEWYAKPPDVIAEVLGGQTDYFLTGTSPATPRPPLPATVHLGGPSARRLP
jgi:membrane peptidoglycan carboxypeptidase